MEISYKLPDFEGPLDLLLFLVQKNKLNIYDIPIHELLEQYLGTIQTMQDLDMEVATEFLDMAARLVQIKSAMKRAMIFASSYRANSLNINCVRKRRAASNRCLSAVTCL